MERLRKSITFVIYLFRCSIFCFTYSKCFFTDLTLYKFFLSIYHPIFCDICLPPPPSPPPGYTNGLVIMYWTCRQKLDVQILSLHYINFDDIITYQTFFPLNFFIPASHPPFCARDGDLLFPK